MPLRLKRGAGALRLSGIWGAGRMVGWGRPEESVMRSSFRDNLICSKVLLGYLRWKLEASDWE